MMLKVIVYAYCIKIYSCRNIARALNRDIHFMWLSANQSPDFNTINRFRSEYLKDILPEIFSLVSNFLLDKEYIKTKDYFIDGTKLEADAGRYSYVWRKNSECYSQKVRERAFEILKEADLINECENMDYGDNDLPEYGDINDLDSDTLKTATRELASKINDNLPGKENRKFISLKNKLKKEADKLKHYEDQLEVMESRNSYSKTDKDATFMRMKNDELRAGYNIQIGSQNSFVTAFSISQNANDATAFIDHMQTRKRLGLPDVENVIADAAYGSEDSMRRSISSNEI